MTVQGAAAPTKPLSRICKNASLRAGVFVFPSRFTWMGFAPIVRTTYCRPGHRHAEAGWEMAARLDETTQAGTAVLACGNSMRGYKLARTQMAGPVAYVPSGVAHLIRRQAKGYADIRS
jgi:hypothetical protein